MAEWSRAPPVTQDGGRSERGVTRAGPWGRLGPLHPAFQSIARRSALRSTQRNRRKRQTLDNKHDGSTDHQDNKAHNRLQGAWRVFEPLGAFGTASRKRVTFQLLLESAQSAARISSASAAKGGEGAPFCIALHALTHAPCKQTSNPAPRSSPRPNPQVCKDVSFLDTVLSYPYGPKGSAYEDWAPHE